MAKPPPAYPVASPRPVPNELVAASVVTELQARHTVAFTGLRGEHDDRQVSCIRPRTEEAAHVHAAQDGQIEVEDDQIGRVGRDYFQRSVTAAHDFSVCAPAALQRVLDQPGDVRLVFHDEHPVFLHRSSH